LLGYSNGSEMFSLLTKSFEKFFFILRAIKKTNNGIIEDYLHQKL